MICENDLTVAHNHLGTTLEHLVTARDAVLQAEPLLTDARKARTVELTNKINDALAYCWRLSICVEGDCRTSQAELRS